MYCATHLLYKKVSTTLYVSSQNLISHREFLTDVLYSSAHQTYSELVLKCYSGQSESCSISTMSQAPGAKYQ